MDYLFCMVTVCILTALTRDNLEEGVGTQIETIAFEHFKPKKVSSQFHSGSSLFDN